MRRFGNVAGAGGSPQDWFEALPFITKWWLVTALLMTASVSFKAIGLDLIYLDWPLIINKFNIWRPVTSAMFFGGFSFPFLITMYFLVTNSHRYEINPFNTGGGGNTADYAFMLIIGLTILSIAAYFLPMPFIASPLINMVMYVWSKREPEAQSSFFGFKFQAMYIPWVYLAFNLLIGSSLMPLLLGIATGHIYYFLAHVAPITYRRQILTTPRWLVDVFAPPARVQVPARHNWGGGRTL